MTKFGMLLALFCSAGVASLAQAAQASEAAGADAKAGNEVSEIVVTGSYAASLEKASKLKREADVVIDAISAEDVGKFPSSNIGEALQRVPGVTLDRTNQGSSPTRGEATHINVRGLPPDFQNVQLNGRNIAVNEAVENGGKEGRQFRFDVLPSDVVSLVEVVKTPTGETTEGGIAGNVNLRTYRPLDIGNRLSLSAKANYGQLVDKVDGSYSALGSWTNADGTFGALLSVVYSNRHARQDRAYQQDPWLTGRNTNLFPAGDVYLPARVRPTIETEDRHRYTAAGSLQYRPNDDFETNVDFLATRLNNSYKEYGVDFFLNGGSLRAGSFTVDANKTAIKGIMDNVQVQLSDETSLQRHDLWSVGVNQKWTPGAWVVSADANYSRADSSTERPIVRTRFVANGTSVAYDFSRGYQELPILTPSISLTDPTLFTSVLSNVQARPQIAWDTDLGLKLDVSRTFDGFITRAAAGVSYEQREHDYWRIDRNAPTFVGVTPAQAGPGSVNPLPYDDFLKGFAAGYPRTWLDPNNALLFAKYLPPALLQTPPTPQDLLTQSHFNEDITSGYAVASFKGELGSIPYSGNVGLRVSSTQQTVFGYTNQVVNGVLIANPVKYEKTYRDVLPSFNLKFDLTEELILRLAASKAISRPSLNVLAPGLSLHADLPTASGGNPEVDPFRAKNYDVSLEWYFDRFGKVSVAGFIKDFDSYITTAQSQLTIPGSKFGTYLLTAPQNGGKAKMTGLELGYQQRFTFLPEPFDGLGAEASYTYVKQDSEFRSGARLVKDSFIGVSKVSYNVVGFYEKGPLAARLGWFWRDHYVARIGPSNGTDEIFDAFGSLDGSVTYAVTPQLKLTFEGINLLDDSVFSYATIKQRPQEIFHYGRTFTAAVRYTF
jgi:iron complex outermembrane receptor protein